MAYILQARTPEGELPRMVWLESTRAENGVRITVANGIRTIAQGDGFIDALERASAGSASCVCSGDVWLERLEGAIGWNLSFVSRPDLPPMEISSFDLACALQRVQFERMTLEQAATLVDGSRSQPADGIAWESLTTSREIAFDC